jgi:3-phosphoshikimate 1-carboxyvinyltransferase
MKYIASSRIDGTVSAPPSKSVGQRALLAAALAKGECSIQKAGACDDVLAAMRIARSLGAEVSREGDDIRVNGGRRPRTARLDCGESGTCLRMTAAIAALFPERFTIIGRGSLMSRPVSMVEEPLRALGVECATVSGLPPVTVQGPLRGGRVSVDGSQTSQFASGLLLALPLCPRDSEVEIRNLVSRDYVALTVSVMARFGVAVEKDEKRDIYRVPGGQRYRPGPFAVEGDWSAAAFVLVAGAVAGRVTIGNLDRDQPDAAVLDALRAAGAGVVRDGPKVEVRRLELRGFEFDATHCPDLFPPLVALACHCSGKSVLLGVRRLRNKESDRAAALAEEFGRLGADIAIRGDRMEIRGGRLAGGLIRSRGDHRIAMAGAVAALASAEGVTIEGADCAAKSYPDFFSDLDAVREKK